MRRSTAMAAFMGVTMVISVFGFAFLQGSPQQQQQEELPTSNVINYQLTQSQRQALATKYGKTLIDFVYDPENCTNCGSLKASLESMAGQFSDQIILSELEVSSSDYIDLPRILMASQIGSWSRKGVVTSDELEKGFCAVVLYPPLGCAIKPQVKANSS